MKTIRGKILLCMSLTVMVSLFFLGVVSIYLNYSSSNQLLRQSMRSMADIAAERVAQELTSYMNVAMDAGATAELADPAIPVERKQEIINQRVKMYGFLRGNIVGADGISILNGNDYNDREYFRQAMTGIPYVSEPLIGKATGEISIMIAAPLWQNGVANTTVIGVVFFVPPETFLNDIVTKINVSEHGAAYIINAAGVTVADNTMDTIMTQNIEEEAKSDPSLKELAQIHAKMRQGEIGFGPYKSMGHENFRHMPQFQEPMGGVSVLPRRNLTFWVLLI